MIHSNSVKIKSINYSYNPKDDEFVKFGKDVYFVCDINIELVSNYINLGKLIQDIYEYLMNVPENAFASILSNSLGKIISCRKPHSLYSPELTPTSN